MRAAVRATRLHWPVVVFCIALLWSMQGCASNKSIAADDGPAYALEMYTRDMTGSESFFRMERDGTLGFGGGMSARLNKITWTGRLTQDEHAQITQLIDAHEWLRSKPIVSGDDRQRTYRISLSGRGRSRTFRLKGESPQVRPVREILEQAARRRLEPDLQRLPVGERREP